MSKLQEEIEQKSKEIITDNYSMSVGELISMYKEGDLDIHPEFQRTNRSHSVWRTIAPTIKADRYQLRSHTKNKWQNETGSVEGLVRRPIGKVNCPPDLKKVNKMS